MLQECQYQQQDASQIDCVQSACLAALIVTCLLCIKRIEFSMAWRSDFLSDEPLMSIQER